MFMAASAASVRRVPTASRSLATALWRARSRAACSALQHQQPELTRLPNTCRQSCRSKMSTISPVEPRRPEPPHPNPLPTRTRIYPSSVVLDWPKSDISDFGRLRLAEVGYIRLRPGRGSSPCILSQLAQLDAAVLGAVRLAVV